MNFILIRNLIPTVLVLNLLTILTMDAQPLDTTVVIQHAFELIDLEATPEEIDLMKSGVMENKEAYQGIRSQSIPNDMPNALVFIPPYNINRVPKSQSAVNYALTKVVELPKNRADLAFYSVADLSVLIRTRKISSVELTSLFIDRLKTYGDTLACVITITEELAMNQARQADIEIKAGKYKGPLHGIPYGVKDLIAADGYKTTWGAAPYKDQQLSETATIVNKLSGESGAVLVAKLTLGALAWGDVWYGGVTKNPWNLEQGSSGSSAGSASATVAGLVPFAIGSETWGSIVSPSTRCGATGLRPTYGSVSKYGAMALSWTMDKLGPICRNSTDLAIVFDAIRGKDGLDNEVLNDYPFNYNYTEKSTKQLRVGYLKSIFDDTEYNRFNDSLMIALLRKEGVQLIEKELPSAIPTDALSIILSVEAAAAFDELTRSNRDDELTRQVVNAWPNAFRTARLIPAVEYIQANRLRYALTRQFNEMMSDIDVLICPSFGGDQLLMTNLTGHPCVVLPNGSYASGNPGSITLVGNHFDEASILAFARYMQAITPYEEEHPDLFRP